MEAVVVLFEEFKLFVLELTRRCHVSLFRRVRFPSWIEPTSIICLWITIEYPSFNYHINSQYPYWELLELKTWETSNCFPYWNFSIAKLREEARIMGWNRFTFLDVPWITRKTLALRLYITTAPASVSSNISPKKLSEKQTKCLKILSISCFLDV